MKIYKTDPYLQEDEDTIAIIDSFMLQKYGIPNNLAEINHYKQHRRVWKEFLNSGEDRCLVIEKSVRLRKSAIELAESLDQLPAGWDLFIPFDKIQADRKELLDIYTARMGYFWGCYIYALSKSGAEKLYALPIIKQPLDEEILDLAFKGSLQCYFIETNIFDYNEKESLCYQERRKAVQSAILNFPAWNPENKAAVRKLIDLLGKIANREGIHLVLHGGTLLGHVRHDGIMPWDDDVDLGIERDRADQFIQAVVKEKEISYALLPHQKPNSFSYFYKFWLEEGLAIDNQDYKFPFVDLWMYDIADGTVSYKEGYDFPEPLYLPFREVLFEHCKLYIPSQSPMVLDLLYEDWDKYIRVYQWSHRLEKPAFKAINLCISVDEKGRAII